MLDLFKRVEKPTVVERFGPRGGYIYVGVFGPWILLVLPGLGIPAALHAHEQGNTPWLRSWQSSQPQVSCGR